MPGSLPHSYSVASFASSTSSGKSLSGGGITAITSRGRHPTLNASMRHGISESLTNLSQNGSGNNFKNNNNGSSLFLSTSTSTTGGLLNLNNGNASSNLSHATSLSALNHLKVAGHDQHHLQQSPPHSQFPLLSPTKSPNHYPVLTPLVQPLTTNTSSTTSSHHRHHNLPNKKITSVVRPVVNDGNHRSVSHAHVRPQQKENVGHTSRASRDRSTFNSTLHHTSTATNSENHPPSSFIIPDARDGQCAGLLDYSDFLPKHIAQYGLEARPPVTELEALGVIAKGHKEAKAVLDYRRRQVAIVLAMWATKDARTALEYAVNLPERAVVVDILNVMVLKP